MNPTDILNQGKTIADSAQGFSGFDIVISILALSSLFITVAFPIVKMIQGFTSEKNTSAVKYEAEKVLYEHLIEQIADLKKSLDDSSDENKRLWEKLKRMEIRLSQLESVRLEYELMKKLLEQKDAEIVKYEDKLTAVNLSLTNREKDIKLLETRIVELERLISKYEEQ